MEEALSFFRAFEVWIYLLLGLGGLIYIRKFVLSWQELQEAAFGLERESAQARLNQSASALVLLLTMAVAEFVLVTFVAPSVPGATPILTPTLDLLATPTTTLAPMTAAASGPVGATPAPGATGAPPEAGPVSTGQNASASCIPDQIMITAPQNGQEVSGIVDVMGTANIPNFGFYKFEMKAPGEESLWQTIQAGSTTVEAGRLGGWDTQRLAPGAYQLALVVVDNQAQASLPCIVEVQVVPTIQGTAAP